MRITATPLRTIPWVEHGFFTRRCGVSGGLYDSLNCAWSTKADDPANVRINRACVAQETGIAPENLVTLDQRHTADVVIATQPWGRESLPVADAIVTSTPHLGIGVLTADCAPVLFASTRDKIIGAAHAGWRGALTGILEATVDEMKNMGARVVDVQAVIGPCIGARSYEVSEDFLQPFLTQDKKNDRFFVSSEKGKGKFLFDLPAYVASRLEELGINKIHDMRQDTLANEATYFSYRRSCLKGDADYGRQISVIALKY